MPEKIEVKTSELVGLALDWAIAQAEGIKYDPHYISCSGIKVAGGPWEHWSISNFAPSTCWAHGGPLIEKYQMDTIFERVGVIYAYPCKEDGLPIIDSEDCFGSYGPTHLIATCRAIVASVLGDTVQIPAELVQPLNPA